MNKISCFGYFYTTSIIIAKISMFSIQKWRYRVSLELHLNFVAGLIVVSCSSPIQHRNFSTSREAIANSREVLRNLLHRLLIESTNMSTTWMKTHHDLNLRRLDCVKTDGVISQCDRIKALMKISSEVGKYGMKRKFTLIARRGVPWELFLHNP